MKKQTFWKAMSRRGKYSHFEEAQGYVIDVTNQHGYTVTVALDYKRPYWYATLYETGLGCTPPNSLCKTKDELIQQLETIDFEKYIKGNKQFENLKQLLADFKNKN